MKKTQKKKENKTYIELLKEDHERVKALFEKFEKTKGESAKKAIVENILQELTVHAKIEEEIVYPEFRKVLEEDLVDEADVEHYVAKVLIGDLAEMEPGDDHYDAKVTVLGEIIDHHVEEEEEEIFPKAEKKVKNAIRITDEVIEKKLTLMGEAKRALKAAA